MKNYFENVIGYEKIKHELNKILDFMNNKEHYEKLGAKLPRNVLLDGPPGVGKTMISKIFLDNCNRNIFILRKDKSEGEFVNKIKEVFEKAQEAAPSVILLDDMDKFPNILDTDRVFNCNCQEFSTIQSCIEDVKEKEVFIIATTNKKYILPDSMLRAGRFDKIFHMGIPNREDSIKIVKHYLKNKCVDENADVDLMCNILYGRSCAELETIVNNAAVNAGYIRKDAIDEDDIVNSYLEEKHGISNNGYETVCTNKLERVAVHEAGHTVVSSVLRKCNVKLVTVIGDGKSMGAVVDNFPLEEGMNDIEEINNEIMIGLGGMAATEIVFGDIDVGTKKDLSIVRDNAINKICLNAELGFNKCIDRYGQDLNFSNDMKNDITKVIASEMENLYLKTKRLIIENKDFFEKIVDELKKKKVLTYKDIAIIEKQCNVTKNIS